MDLRDYWRIIRRQWIWTVSVFVFMLGVYFSYVVVEEQYYRASSIIGIKLPEISEKVFRETSPLIPPATYSLQTKIQLLETENLRDLASKNVVEILFAEEALFHARTQKEKTLAKDEGLPFQDVVAAVAREFQVKPKMHKGREIYFFSDIQKSLPPDRWGSLQEMEREDEVGEEAKEEAGHPLEKKQTFLRRLVAEIAPRIPGMQTQVTEQRSQLVVMTVEYLGQREPVVLVNALARAAVQKDIKEEEKNRKKEIAAVKEHLKDSEAVILEKRKEIENFQRENGVEEINKDLVDARAKMREIELLIRAKEAERIKIDYELQNPPPIPMVSGMLGEETPQIVEIRSGLTKLEQQRAVLLLDFKEAHPDIKRLDVQIREQKVSLEREIHLEEARQQDRHMNSQIQLGDKKRLMTDELDKLYLERSDAEARFKDLSEKRWAYEELVTSHKSAGEQREKLKQRLAALELLQRVNEKVNRGVAQEKRQSTGTIKLEKEASSSDPVRKHSKDALGFMVVIAIVVSIGIAYVVEYADTRIRTEQDVRKHLNLPVLAKIEKRERGEKVVLTDLGPRDPFSEIFNTVSTVISSAAKDLGLKTFVISSTVAEEGKTTISVNLGVALARKGLRVILVDGDLRRPQLHDLLGADNSSGLSTILEGRTEAMQALGEITGEASPRAGIAAFLRPTPVENLKVLTSGPTPNDPITLLESKRMKDLIEELKGIADFVLIDTPPIFHVGDVLTLSPLVDANLFVVGAFEVKQHEVAWAKHLLANVEANILGVFLNKEVIESKSYYYYYRYYKGYRYRN